MTPKEKAQDLVNQFRMVLMAEDTECGNELLCTSIAIKNALICCDEFQKFLGTNYYWMDVKQELEKL